MREPTLSLPHGRFIVGCLILGSLAMIAVIWTYYARQREAIEATTAMEVAAIAKAQVNQIASWRRERLGDGRVLASSTTMRIAQRVLSNQSRDAPRYG